ncbi:hypothetical protein M407DRAFT_137450 [Tulasnella calospora MUT 4182]|uniref:Uncharacterized protein n=1 Tax=Tulasnella calospora MUT 4182 TaxID=1051891 RepID=A0A0C3LG62_9AGAM|nr:hypothetical protein M407DRAFT_137450 [Tulasnella calospora MUT 4182]
MRRNRILETLCPPPAAIAHAPLYSGQAVPALLSLTPTLFLLGLYSCFTLSLNLRHSGTVHATARSSVSLVSK